jgi:hypothetical protein
MGVKGSGWNLTVVEGVRHNRCATATNRRCCRFVPERGAPRAVVECQTVCKPGSVPRHEGGRRPFLWDACRQAPRATDPGDGAKARLRRAGSHRRRACRPYLVLLRVGFAMPVPLPGPRCALTAPFHPCLPPRGGVGGVLSVALSLDSHPPGVTRHPCFRGARTFLERPQGPPAAVRPSGYVI